MKKKMKNFGGLEYIFIYQLVSIRKQNDKQKKESTILFKSTHIKKKFSFLVDRSI